MILRTLTAGCLMSLDEPGGMIQMGSNNILPDNLANPDLPAVQERDFGFVT